MKFSVKNVKFFLQPIVSTKNKNNLGFEVLVRIISNNVIHNPNTFIHLMSDDNHHILTKKLMINAFRMKQKFMESGVLLFFNIDQSLFNKEFLNFLNGFVNFYNIGPEMIALEVLEDKPFTDQHTRLNIIKEIKGNGFKIAIDDYGSGHSTLGRILDIEPDFIKIDRSIIDSASKNNKKKIAIESTLELASKLNIKIIAEGIEMPSDLEYLKTINIDYYQGYYFSKPINPAAIKSRADLCFL
jgi:EAL domain-containing protein (putative c-di-GMP-specific phosphodiesterase class I)